MHLKAIPVPPEGLPEEVTHSALQSVCPMISRFNPQFANLSFGNADEDLMRFSRRFLNCNLCRWLLLFILFDRFFSLAAGLSSLRPASCATQAAAPCGSLCSVSGCKAEVQRARPQYSCNAAERGLIKSLLCSPWDPKAQRFGEEILEVSVTREQRNLNKRALETSAWNWNSDLLSSLLLWRQLNIFLLGFLLFTILGVKERAGKFLFPPPPPVYRLWQSSWNWISNFLWVGNTCRPADLHSILQTSQLSPVLSRYSVLLLLPYTVPFPSHDFLKKIIQKLICNSI